VKILVVTVQKRAKTCCDWVYEILAIVELFVVLVSQTQSRHTTRFVSEWGWSFA
jgi:hypothetical protein